MSTNIQRFVDGAGNKVDFDGSMPELVERELDALRAIYQAPGRVMLAEYLRKQLNGFDHPAQEIRFLEQLGLISRYGAGSYQLTEIGRSFAADASSSKAKGGA